MFNCTEVGVDSETRSFVWKDLLGEEVSQRMSAISYRVTEGVYPEGNMFKI